MACVHYLVSGRVQGVFYRATTQEVAGKLDLVGWVRNKKDGTVDLLACGPEGTLKELERWLWDGPKFADVKKVEAEPTAETGEAFKGFSVRY